MPGDVRQLLEEIRQQAAAIGGHWLTRDERVIAEARAAQPDATVTLELRQYVDRAGAVLQRDDIARFEGAALAAGAGMLALFDGATMIERGTFPTSLEEEWAAAGRIESIDAAGVLSIIDKAMES